MERLKETGAMMGRLMQDMPTQLKNFSGFVKVAEAEGAIEEKTKHLMLLSLGVAFQCSWCIAIHVKGCVDQGSSKEEILEAAMMAVVMGGGPKLMYMEVVYEELDKYFPN
ncbi:MULTISPECIES: carboxymuconolactone decarboxylase family protein [Thiomicrorhabdus]|uniref:Carboxymuconolactone decarboxylase family protein n=1 Tax=Thiomicrorhabdus heinhorstiae TaxID=2748010 RepID=A0ABS0BWC4_9GAMM|nr:MULTISPECIES: carboxymuconolactone decarboxylase family protein [Thiomicrorhabdus]MBF6057111.1 carboxymuconolactone decarboxylase family protein [Thiomicrorhabdus heinhorstiae]